MSKFFAQVFLSLVLGAGAAVGFQTDVRGNVQGTVREVKAFAHEVTQSVFEAANIEAEADVSTNVDAAAEASAEADVQIEADTDLDLGSQLDDVSLESSVSTEAEVDAQVDLEDTGLGLESTLDTLLDLGIGE